MSCAHSRGGLHRVDNGLISGAATVIPGKMLADPLPVRLGLLCQEVLRGHQHSRRAIATLQRIAIAKHSLQVRDLTAVGQALDSLDRCAVQLNGQYQAGTNDVAIHAHRASSTKAVFATDMGSGQLEMFAQEIRQIESRENMRLDALAIDIERDRNRTSHAFPPALRSGRPRSAATPRAISTFARCLRIEADA